MSGGGNNQAGNGTSSLTDRIYGTVAGGLSNSASGGFLTPDQRAAFARFVARGGGPDLWVIDAVGIDYDETKVPATKYLPCPGE